MVAHLLEERGHLVERRAEINVPTFEGRTPLTTAGQTLGTAGVANKDVDAEIFGIEGCVVVGATTHRAGEGRRSVKKKFTRASVPRA